MKQDKLTEQEVRAVFDAVNRGEVIATPDQDPLEHYYSGNLGYALSNGWRVVVFNDCHSFDYIDSMTAPDGRSMAFPEVDVVCMRPPDEFDARWGFKR